jgi:hypothetical protein
MSVSTPGAGKPVDRRFQRDALFHPGLVVAQVNAGLDAVKRRRRHRQVTLGGEAVRHGLDVRVDAENFLQDHHSGLGFARRLGHVGRKHKAVSSCQIDEFTHDAISLMSISAKNVKKNRLA